MTRLAASARQLLRKLRRDRKGSISLLAGFSLFAVVGFAGLGTEAAYWYVKERNMQSAADSGAIAAAAATLANDTSANANTAATTMAAQYGFSGGGCGSTGNTVVCINNPPSTGNYTGDNTAWEVIVSQKQPLLFSALLMHSNPTISTRAVAKQIAVPAPSCVVTLDTTKLFPDLQDNGTANVSMPNCNVFVNSCDPNGALTVSGNGQYLANASYVCGNIVKSGAATMTDTTATDKNTNTTYANPYANTTFAGLFGSDTPPCQYSNTTVNAASGSSTLMPGVYCNGLTINGSPSGSGGTVTLSPGAYIIEGQGAGSVGFQINGNATVNGTGVTIGLTAAPGDASSTAPSNWAGVSINGNATVTLSAPLPGAAQGSPAGAAPFLFYQNQNAPVVGNGTINNKFNGNANDKFQGVFYFPNQELQWNGNSNIAGTCTQLVVYQVVFNGTNNFKSDAFNCKDLGVVSLNAPGGTAVALVE